MKWFREQSRLKQALFGLGFILIGGILLIPVPFLTLLFVAAGVYALYISFGSRISTRWIQITAIFLALSLPFTFGSAVSAALFATESSTSVATSSPSSSTQPTESPTTQEEAPENEALDEPDSDSIADSDNEVVVTPKAIEEASTEASSGSFRTLIAQLDKRPEAGSGYDRDLFKHWIDSDRDGCDTREEVLISESVTPVKVGSSCSISGGTWVSAFDGLKTTDSSSFDVDHFVPLKEAWDSGASTWSSATRQAFANDLDYSQSLIAVSASSNRSKSDRDPADWTPSSASYKCEYVYSWVQVKLRWGLSADDAEVSALENLSQGCDITKLNLQPSDGAPVATQSPTPKPSATSSPKPTSTSPQPTQTADTNLDQDYGTCKAAKAAGKGPYYKGIDPEYDWYQDRDKDGIVCE